MARTTAGALLLALALALAAVGPASAEVIEKTYRTGPIEVDGYQVKQGGLGIEHPKVDGFVTKMDVDVVDADGKPVPISRLMLHHIVFLNAGRFVGDRRDGTCGEFTLLDSKSKVPAYAERFFAAGEERAKLVLPPGHGYPVKGDDRWAMTYMLMNHRQIPDKAYVQYRVTYDTSPDTEPVTPYWLDVENCKSDPVYDVPGGGRKGSTHSVSSTWTSPKAGRIVAGGGHVHGGAKSLVLSQPDCGDRTLFSSEPLWGSSRHPFYNVKPVLHEPGPVNMSGFISSYGFRVAAGQRLKLTSNYDNELPHTRVMGIGIFYMAEPTSAIDGCEGLPGDVLVGRSSEPGRTRAPAFRVPLTGIGPNGRAREIAKPPGRTRRMRGGATIGARDFAFTTPNVSVRPGTRLRWAFRSDTLHDVTVADGPRGFSSPHLNGGRTFAKKLTTPGTYKYFCSLHPVDMTGTVTVARKRRR